MKELFNRKITYIIIGWLLILAAVALDEGITVPRYKINSEKIKKPLRIVLLTDFHSSSYGKKQQVLIDVIDKQTPDIILLAGDIAENVRNHKHTEELLEQISGKVPLLLHRGQPRGMVGRVRKDKGNVPLIRRYGA